MNGTEQERIEAVQRMLDAIETNLGSPVTLHDLALSAGYSLCHAARLFREVMGIPPLEYLRARRLSEAALRLRDTRDRVLEVALDHAFESHEGFTRAFERRFGSSPEAYRRTTPPVPLFTPRGLHYLLECSQEINSMSDTKTVTVFVELVERPARKLILKRGSQATEYFAYCDEVGCDVWGELLSLVGALYEPMGLWLPESLRKPGTSEYVMGVEMPADYAGPVPDGMETIDLPPCSYLLFQGQPYAEEEMGRAIGDVWKAIETYDPEPSGWRWSPDTAPRIQYAPIAERGYIECRPVVKR